MMKQPNKVQVMMIHSKRNIMNVLYFIFGYLKYIFHIHRYDKWYKNHVAVNHTHKNGLIFVVAKVRKCKKCDKKQIK